MQQKKLKDEYYTKKLKFKKNHYNDVEIRIYNTKKNNR